MAIYRALRDLDTGKRRIRGGTIFPASWLKPHVIPILEEQQKIAIEQMPPISAIPRLKMHSAAFRRINVKTTGDLLEADDSAIAKALKISEAEARQIKAELYAQFASPRPKR